MYLKYFLFSFCNGELFKYEEFETKEQITQYLKENKYLEDLQIIHGWEVKEENV